MIWAPRKLKVVKRTQYKLILIKWDSQVMSNWMWLQFALYVKSKSRLFWKCQKFTFPNICVYIWWDVNRIGIKYNKFDRIIGLDYWIGSLDIFFSPKLWRGCLLFRAGACFLLFLHMFAHNCHILSTKVISGPDFLKNDDIWSDFTI